MQMMTLERETRICLKQSLAELEVLADKLQSHQRKLENVIDDGQLTKGQSEAYRRSIKRAWGAEQHARRAADTVREAMEALDPLAGPKKILVLAD